MEAVKINKYLTKVTVKTKVNGKSYTLNLVFLTILYKFLLKEKVLEQFINNTIAYRGLKDIESEPFDEILCGSFDSSSSPEGRDYWYALDDKFDLFKAKLK